jgi:single-stranded-DNA-specific exonuclease
MAGVGVMFYVLLALRTELRNRGRFDRHNQPRSTTAAPGGPGHGGRRGASSTPTTAAWWPRACNASVPAPCPPASRAVPAIGREAFDMATTFDFGFALGPRINAAGRLPT